MVLGLTTGCHRDSNRWTGDIRQWGSMHEVLGQGKTEGRVQLADAASKPHSYGVGALEKLAGEVTIIDGVIYRAQTQGDAIRVAQSTDDRNSAALLAVAYVPQWRGEPIDRDITNDEVEDFIKHAAESRGLATDEPFPFRIDGPIDASVHVINGACPNAPAASATSAQPLHCSEDAYGTIVGFFAENGAGTLTHHGSRTHMHVVFDANRNCSGHVDQLTIHAGAILKLP
jgi:alpha-acetolactate decarboxylase